MAEQEKIMKASEYLSKMNVQLNDENLLFASGGAGSSSSAAYKVGDTVRWISMPEMVGTVKTVYLNEKNPAYSKYDVKFPDITMCDMKHGWLEKV
jgi:hypothetical protein